MATGLSPIQRTLRELRASGRKCEKVERWNPFAGRVDGVGIRQDLFGIIDILALDPERGVIGIQVCSGSSWAKHFMKMTMEKVQDTYDWLSTPGTCLELWGWRKVKAKRGGKAMLWQAKVREICLGDLQHAEEREVRPRFNHGDLPRVTTCKSEKEQANE